MGPRRKRNTSTSQHSEDSADEIPPKKKKDDTSNGKVISEVEFKFLLRDQETVTSGLENFIYTAEAVTEGAQCPDIVAGYCRSSETCSELFTLIDPGSTQLKMHDISLVFECLELILTRIRTDLLKYSSIGEAVVQKLLAGHMGQLYNCLRDQNNSKSIKAGLELLIAMVMLSERAKKAVLTRLNFQHVNFPPLFRRRNRKDPKDVRSCVVLLTLAFLLDSDNNTVNTLVQQKSFLQLTISGLKFDTKDMVVDVLATLLDKVVKCPAVTKTDKIKLFSENVLKQLCELYHWQGPGGWVAGGKKRRDKDEKHPELSGSEAEDQAVVADVAHEFLTELCCSHRYGVNFYDKTLGTGTRNQNQLLSHLVQWLAKKIEEPRNADLITGILCACPDQIKAILTQLCPSFSPRWSDKWKELVDWLIKLYSDLPDVPAFLTSQEKLKLDQAAVVTMATVFCLPPSKVAAMLAQSLKHDDIRLHQKYLELVRVLARKATLIQKSMAESSLQDKFSSSEGTLTEMFTASVLKALPPTSQLFVCVDKIMQVLSKKEQKKKKKVEKLALNLDDDMEIDLSAHTVVLLQVLSLYQTLSPSLFTDKPKELAKVIDLVSKLQSVNRSQGKVKGDDDADEEEEDMEDDEDVEMETMMPQLYLMKLLADADVRKLALGREGLLEKLLQSAEQSGQYKDLTISFICKMLNNLEVFKGHDKELQIWLHSAVSSSTASRGDSESKKKTVGASSPNVVFIARCLATLLNNPGPYVDRLMETAADVAGSGCAGDQEMDTSSVGTNDGAIDAILLMDDDELDKMLDTHKPSTTIQQMDGIHLPFSPLALVALDNLQYSKTADENMKEYVSKVLVHLVHFVSSPACLASVINKSEAKLALGVRKYMLAWQTGKFIGEKLKAISADICNAFTTTLMEIHLFNIDLESSGSQKEAMKSMTAEMGQMALWELWAGLGQVVLYMSDVISSSRFEASDVKTLLQTYGSIVEALLNQIERQSSKEQKGSSVSTQKAGRHHGETSSDISAKEPLDTNASGDEKENFEELILRDQSSENDISSAVRFVLLNKNLKAFVFDSSSVRDFKTNSPSPRKKKKQKKQFEIISEIRPILINVLEKFSNRPWFQSENTIIQEYLQFALERLYISKEYQFQEEDTNMSIRILQILSPLLDMSSLSKCVGRLLDIPRRVICDGLMLDDTNSDGGSDSEQANSQLTPFCQILCQILQSWIEMIEKFNSNSILRVLKTNGNKKLPEKDEKSVHRPLVSICVYHKKCIFTPNSEASNKDCIEIPNTFCLEQDTDLKLSSFPELFLILNDVFNEKLDKLIASLLKLIPELVLTCEDVVFDRMFPDFTKLTSPRQEIMAILIENRKECFEDYADYWLRKHADDIDVKNMWWLMRSYLETQKFCSYYEKRDTITELRKSLTPKLGKLMGSCDENVLVSLKLLLEADGEDDEMALEEALIKEATAFLEDYENSFKLDDAAFVCHYQLLKTSFLKCQTTRDSKGHHKYAKQSGYSPLDIVIRHLSYLTKGKKRHTQKENYLLDLALDLIPHLREADKTLLYFNWGHLVVNSLRSIFTSAKLLKLLIQLLPFVYATDFPHTLASPPSTFTDPHMPVEKIFGLCIGHTAFSEVVLKQEHAETKAELVKLLYHLAEMATSCYKPQLTQTLVGAYGASLSQTDQYLLLMIKKCSVNSDKKFECPTLWGQAAVEHQSVSQVLGASLDSQASVKAIIEQLDSSRIQESILNFPVRRSHQDTHVMEASEFKSLPQCYDPNFLLRLFVQILSPDKMVPLRQFAERGCLSYLLISLTSHDLQNRLLAYQALNDFYLHAEGSRWHEKTEVTFVLDLLNASRVKDGQKLPFVVALFFSRVVKLMLFPGDPLYMPIFRFLVAKPEIDLGNVPEFYKLFFSAGVQGYGDSCCTVALGYNKDIHIVWAVWLLLFHLNNTEYKQERNWMLSLLRDGMRETSDYWLYQKRFMFKILMNFYDSAISDAHSRELVLQIVRNACKEKSAAVDLVKNHSLLSWLSAAVAGLKTRPEHTGLLCDIIQTCWVSLTTTRYLNMTQKSQKSQTPGTAAPETGFVKSDEDESDDETYDSGRKDSKGHSVKDDVEESDEDSDNESLDGVNKEKKSSRQTRKEGKTSAPTVPVSTRLEMGLIVKNLIWHLSDSSPSSLMKVLSVLLSMLSITPLSTDKTEEIYWYEEDGDILENMINFNRLHQHDPYQYHQLISSYKNLLHLSPVESCLLLFHIAKAIGHSHTAQSAASILKDRGVNVDLVAKKPNRKSALSKGDKSLTKGRDLSKGGNSEMDNTDMAELNEVEEKKIEENEDKENVLEKTSSRDNDVSMLKVGKTEKEERKYSDEDRNLVQIFYEIVQATDTLYFVQGSVESVKALLKTWYDEERELFKTGM